MASPGKFLVHDPAGGYSASKFWTLVANGTATFIMVYLTLHGGMSTAYLIVYMGVVGGSEIAKKLITLYFGAKNTPPTDPSGSAS